MKFGFVLWKLICIGGASALVCVSAPGFGQVTPTGGVSNIVGSAAGATQNVLSLGEIGSGSDGEVSVSGANTFINFFDVNQLTAGVTIGTQNHSGRLTINNGATVFSTATVPGLDNAFVHISRSANGVSNSALGTVVLGDDPLSAGNETKGFMTITSGNADAYLGVGRTGPGVLDLNNSELRIRALGPGSGGSATADSAVLNIGDTATSTAVGTVTATDSIILVEATGGGNATVSVGRRTNTVANPNPALAPESTILLEAGTVMDVKSANGVAQFSVGRDNARGRATVDGGTTALNVEDLVRIGRDGGLGTLTVQNGANVDNFHSGKSSETRVGESGGTGTLNVLSGAGYTATDIVIGDTITSSGTANVSGSGTTLAVSGANESTTAGVFDSATLAVGKNGTGVVNINSGGQLTVTPGVSVNGGLSGGMVIGGNRDNPNGTGDGIVNVDGAGSALIFSNSNSGVSNLQVGRDGTGTLNITNGGLVDGTTQNVAAIARKTGSTGTANIIGVGSTWRANQITVGLDVSLPTGSFVSALGGNGTLNVDAGGLVEAVDTAIAGTANITGAGKLDVSNEAIIGRFSGSMGIVNVNGAASEMSVGDTISIGRDSGSAGTLNIGDNPVTTGTVETGGTVRTHTIFMSASENTSSTINVSGAAASLIVEGQAPRSGFPGALDGAVIDVGLNGTAVLNITGGATVKVAPGLVVGDGLSGGLVVGGKSSNPIGTGDGVVNVDGVGSTLTFSNENGQAGFSQIGRDGTGVLNITNGGVVDSSDQLIASVGRKVGGNGTVNVTGTGSEWRAAATVYLGLDTGLSTPTINGLGGTGTLNVANGGMVVAGNINVVGQGKITGGGGTIRGNIIVGANTFSGGSIGPGNSPGLMQVLGNVDLLGGSTMVLELGGLVVDSGYDRLDVADDPATPGVVEGNLSIAAGTIFDIDYFGVFTAAEGDSFDVLVADDISAASIASLLFDFSGAALTFGLTWDAAIVGFGGGRDALRLTVVADQVSEPGTIIVFLFGLGLIVSMRLRSIFVA